MKRTLFTAALLFAVYCLVAVLYTFAAERGILADSARAVGLTDTSTVLHQTAVHTSSTQASHRSFIDPVPIPPPPRPQG